MSPNALGQGATSVNVHVNGTGFVSGANATFSGSGITVTSTSFGSSTQLTANVTLAAGATVDARNVTVTNADSGVGTGTGVFTVDAAPTVTSTSPNALGEGATDVNVEVNGTGFVSGANATFSGSGITVNSTAFVSSTQVTANVTIAGGATVGARNVTVTNPDSGVGTGTGVFTVDAAPTVTSTAPSALGRSATDVNVDVNGTGFVSGANATFSGSGITVNSTTFDGSTELTANVTITGGATLGARNVTVTNPDSGVGTGAGVFTVDAAPTVTSTSPNALGEGATDVNVDVNGTGFVSGASATFSGSGITVNSTAFVSSTQVTANVTITGGATVGARTVTVTNADLGAGTGTGVFTVDAAPTVTSTSPNALGEGATSVNVHVNGTGFVSGANATFSGLGITVNSTAFVSSTQVTANVTITGGATVGARNVTVTNPDSGVGTGTGVFTVDAAPTVTSTSPSALGEGATDVNVDVNGTGFVTGANATFSGAGITVHSTSFDSSTELVANVSIAGGATVDARNVTVTNPDSGVGTGTGVFTVDPAPTVSSTTPSSEPAGSTGVTVDVNGTGFVSGANATFSGSGITVNSTGFVSSVELTANVTITAGATLASSNVTVTNPDLGVGSGTDVFAVSAGGVVSLPSSPYDFGSQGVTAGATPTHNFTLTNSGTGDLVITTAALSGGDSGQFNVTADSCSGQTIEPTDTCTVTVDFEPSSNGAKTTNLTFTDDAGDSPQQSVELEGTGAGGTPAVSLAPVGPFDFGNQAVAAGATATHNFVLTNSGSADLAVTSATLTGTDPNEFNVTADSCSGQTVDPTDTCTVSVDFEPTANGAQTADLTFTDDAGDSPQSVVLNGAGGQAPAISSAASATFTVGIAGSFTVDASGVPGGPTLALSDGGATLPGGVTFVDNGNGTATLAGTPAAGSSGSYPFTITASNGFSPAATQSFTLTVAAGAVTSAPPPPSAPPGTFGTPTSGTAQAGSVLTVTASSGAGVSGSVSVPAGALPAGTVVSVYPVTDPAALQSDVPAGQSYVLSFAISWQAPDGTSPTASAPITMTITDPSITAGETIYALTSSGLTAVGVATQNGTATITFTNDPVFVVASLTAAHLSLKDHRGTTIVGYDAKAKAGTKVTVELIRSHKVVKKTIVKVAATHQFIWSTGKLASGTDTVRFLVGRKLVKTTTITIAGGAKKK
jgi:hypothetical protein